VAAAVWHLPVEGVASEAEVEVEAAAAVVAVDGAPTSH
jgi:hypothetical protein